MLPICRPRTDERGMALIMVLLVMLVLFVLLVGLLFEADTERIVSANEQDHAKALTHAESGLAWAERRLKNSSANISDLLDGPNNGSATDDNLLGLRSLSLTDATQFTSVNEGTASAIVTANVDGTGSKKYEAVRLMDDSPTRALVYVRVDDNYDDDDANPSNNVPLIDTDRKIRVTSVAHYPVFVGSSGAEVASALTERGRARRTLVATYASTGGDQPAIHTDGDLDFGGSTKVCGACGSVHTNRNLYVNSGNQICQNGTASGTFSGTSSAILGSNKGGGFPVLPVPIINPFDDLFVPAPTHFGQLSCPAPSATDPGPTKYFAFLPGSDGMGRVYKAYWDFTNLRWSWRLIDNLGDGTNTMLDNCGRVKSGPATLDPSAGTAVNDTKTDEFYGFKVGSKISKIACSSCGSSGGDQSLCSLANNDFTKNTYWNAGAVTPLGQNAATAVNPIADCNSADCDLDALPGSGASDTLADWNPTHWHKDGNWVMGASTVWSPLYGAILFAYGNIVISGNPGNPSSLDYCSSSGCVASMPNNHWKVSLISYGDIEISGQMTVGPANAVAGYYYQAIAGRDLKINGNPNEYSVACSSGCASGAPANIAEVGGIYAAHEQINTSGNPKIFGFLVAEDAVDCSTTQDDSGRGLSSFGGNPQVFYDCTHPPSPWAGAATVERESWQEVE